MIRWISWANNHLNRAADTVMWERVTKQRYGMGAADGAQVKTAMEDAIGLLPVLDGALTEGAFPMPIFGSPRSCGFTQRPVCR